VASLCTKLALLAVSAMLVAVPYEAYALCKAGTVVGCSIHGQPGTKECLDAGTFSPCEPTVKPPPPVTGTVTGKYLVLTVIYAPPGTNGGKSASNTSYESDSSTGTTSSNSSSFKQDYSVSATVKFGLGCSTDGSGKTTCPLSVGGGASFEYTKNDTHTDALDMKKTVSSKIVVPGPSADGVDHDRDEIWLLLRPKWGFTVSGKSVTWTFDPDQSQAVVQFVFVGALKDPTKLAPGVLRDLQAAGITTQDYAEILAADPLSQCLPPVALPFATPRPNGPSVCNTPVPAAPRYVSAFTSVPYDPPFAQGDTVTTQTITIDNSLVSTQTDSSQYSNKIGITVESGLDFKPVFEASLKEENDFTWTETNTTSNLAGSEQKMSLTMGGPAFGYTGPVNMAVYYDTLYKTFAFVPFEISGAGLHGVVSSTDGKPRAGQAVTAVAAGIKYRAFTNAVGEYRFPSEIAGPIILQAGNVVQQLPQVQSDMSIDLQF
jgi:hypothetical protein